MPKLYHVWIEIEEYDEHTGHGRTIDGPGSAVASFGDFKQAWSFANQLTECGKRLKIDAINPIGGTHATHVPETA